MFCGAITSGFRNGAAYGLIASTIGFVFVSVGGAGLIANLLKSILGRARPKLFETVSQFEFQLFAFDPDYASMPSGHATTIFAFATVIAILWPRGRVLLYTAAAWIAASRVLIGAHYFTDVVLGAALGTAFPYLVRDRFAARRWLFERTAEGGYRIRGPRTQAWLGWPERVRVALHGPKLLGDGSRNPGKIAQDRCLTPHRVRLMGALRLYKLKGNPHIGASAQGAREPLMSRFTSSSNLL